MIFHVFEVLASFEPLIALNTSVWTMGKKWETRTKPAENMQTPHRSLHVLTQISNLLLIIFISSSNSITDK